ncbi:MAG: lysophospholipid acyltransferase family protein [Planctomycetota bacterium]
MHLIYWMGWLLTGLYAKLWHAAEYRGTVPREGGLLVLANHASFLDPPFIGFGTGRFCAFMARASLFRFPPFGWLLRTVGAFPVERGAADRRSIEAAIDQLRAGHVLVLFPEGTRSVDGSVGAFKRGVELLVRRSGVPVVPAAIHGSGEAFGRGVRLPRPRKVRVRFGAPIPAAEVAELGVEGLRARVLALLGAPHEGAGSAAPEAPARAGASPEAGGPTP